MLNLMYLFKNLPTNTKLGLEILRAIDFFVERNTFEKNQQKRVKVTLDEYLKLNSMRMSITKEMRRCFLGKLE